MHQAFGLQISTVECVLITYMLDAPFPFTYRESQRKLSIFIYGEWHFDGFSEINMGSARAVGELKPQQWCVVKTWSICRGLCSGHAHMYKRLRLTGIGAQFLTTISRNRMSAVQGNVFLLLLLVWLALIMNTVVMGSPAYRSERTGRSYTDIARVVNPHPYAFVGSRNYPGQPFWPAGR